MRGTTLVSMSFHPLDLIRTLSVNLQQRPAETEVILDVLPIGIAIADDPLCRATRVNRALARLIGLEGSGHASLSEAPVGPLPMKAFKDGRAMTHDERPMCQAATRVREVSGVVVDFEAADGGRITLMEYAAPLFDVSGKVRGALGIFVDISERRRIEEEQRFLAKASSILSSSLHYETTLKALARLAVPKFGDYCTVDVMREDGTFARVELVVDDPARAEIAEALRRYPPILSVEGPAVVAIRSGEPYVENAASPEKAQRSAQSAEHLELLRRFGVRSFMMVPLRSRGRTLGLLGAGSFTGRQYDEHDLALAQDVAARAALALDTAILYRNAQEANRLKEDFLATLSHELRTPLNALLGWMHMLKMPSVDDATKRRALESIERNARAQSILINDLLDVSRVISGKLRIEQLPVDLPSVVLAAVDAVRPAVRAREIDLNVSLGSVTREVWGDADRLQQVMWNLLSNAVKFTPLSGRVDVAVEEFAGAVQISVADNGAGIDSAFLPHVFERFRQADSSTTRMQAGLGLGLAIVRHLVDLHGGTVTVASAGLGKGSTFTVTLPTRVPPVAYADRPPTADQLPSLRGIRVLAVDDDADSRELILLTVRAADAVVLVVSSAASALDAISTFHPHVIVADLAMPGMDGYGLIRETAKLLPGRMPPMIAMSAYVSPEDIERSLQAGFARHLGKPADYQRLVTTIAELAGVMNSME
jgi:signal transduction histidine kinase/ActR/RegA family two-component response regulator